MTAINLKDDNDNFEASYCDCIDAQGPVVIGGLEYQASLVLRLVDNIAYSCGLNDYVDSCEDQWKCGECGAVFDTEEEAEECCAVFDTEEDAEE